jgi:hypothetical protein
MSFSLVIGFGSLVNFVASHSCRSRPLLSFLFHAKAQRRKEEANPVAPLRRCEILAPRKYTKTSLAAAILSY